MLLAEITSHLSVSLMAIQLLHFLRARARDNSLTWQILLSGMAIVLPIIVCAQWLLKTIFENMEYRNWGSTVLYLGLFFVFYLFGQRYRNNQA